MGNDAMPSRKAADLSSAARDLGVEDRRWLARELLDSDSSGTAPRLARSTVGVIGSGSDPHAELAEPLGRLLARLEVNLLTGGGRGVMEAVAGAYVQARPGRGISIGVLPCSPDDATVPPPGYPNPHVQLAVSTHLPDRGRKGQLRSSRNHVNVLTSDAIVALPGSHGTESEARLAIDYRKPILVYGSDASTVAQFPDAIERVSSLAEVESFLRRVLRPCPDADPA